MPNRRSSRGGGFAARLAGKAGRSEEEALADATRDVAEASDDLRAEQIAALYRNVMPGTVASFVAAILLSAMLVFADAISSDAALAFLALIVLHSLARIFLLRAYRRAKPPSAEWGRWARYAMASALAGGLCWGFGSLLLMDPTHVDLQFIVLLVCAGIAAGAVTAFATYLPAYYANMLSIMAPTTAWAALQADLLHRTYAALALLWIIAIAVLARSYNRILADSLKLQFANLDLAVGFRRQKELAEAANLAKSRFLASASHDLRQPVHALGMFVGALRTREMDPEARRLVDQIDGSIGALDALFISLLDISRLDAGVIQPQPRAFPILPLLQRICREESAEAARKSVELCLVPNSAVVFSDEVLLERILRNLVSNAVRYTESGRVVVGCRRGARLSIEVWDSGRGIPLDQQELIFQEFYQLGNPERDRSKGLGLGLAIVRRLADLLDTPLSLRSEPGRGSAFKLSVALASSQRNVGRQPVETSLSGASSRLILVVDDEVAIQEAMTSLLDSWGHQVVAAGSGDEMLKRVAGLTAPPDLIIADYRLRADENGVAAIHRLRAEFNDEIPAILMTGDTAPDRLREASAGSCFLMHKPVANAKLRAAITNLTLPRSREASPN